MNNTREKWIDNAKGLAMLMVIIGHLSGDLTGIWDFSFVYGIHLVMFFILAGYTTRKKEITSEFLNQKFHRLMIPYFITCGAIMLTDIVNCYMWHDGTVETVTRVIGVDLTRNFFASGSATYFGTIDIGTRIGAIWFLPAMFFAVVFFQIVLKYSEDRDDIAGILSAGIAVLGVITARFIWFPFSVQAGMMATFFFWIGYIVKKQQLLSKLRWYHYIIAQIILLIGIYKGYCNVAFANADINDWMISIAVGLSGCLLVYLCAVLYRGKILEYIGKNSLIVLCTHLYALETMATYVVQILDKLSLEGNRRVWVCIAIEVLFAVVTAFIIEKASSYVKKNSSKFTFMHHHKAGSKRDATIDVVKGILIIAMLTGHFAIDARLRTIIYSCHMIAFVFLSGYFYKSSRKCTDSLKRMAKSFLIPYGCFVLGTFILDINQWNVTYFKSSIIKYLLGISFAKNLLTDVGSVGPVYFILLLFVVRIIYMLIDKVTVNEFQKWFATFILSLFGVWLGNQGCWLPWSLDVALYCLVFYKAGLFFKQKGILAFIKNNYYIYFLIAPVWVYMIYQGGMEIAIRRYGSYGLVIADSIMGVLTIYIFADYLQRHVFPVGQILNELGQDTIYIIIIHTLLDSRIQKAVELRFMSGTFTHMVFCILLELVIAVAVKYIITLLTSPAQKRNMRTLI